MRASNGGWTWIVAAMPGVGDVAMQVRAGVLQAPVLMPAITARRLTIFAKVQEEQGIGIKLVKPMLDALGAMPEEIAVRSDGFAYWAVATADAIGKLDALWSPVAIPTLAETAKLVRLP